MRILTVTGYKPFELNISSENDPRITFIKEALKRRLIAFIEEGMEWVLISGQMGVELWTADVVLDLKEDYDIHIAVFPPFENQENRWPEHLQEKFQEITFTADFYKTIYKGDYKGPYQFKAKDKWLIDKSEAALMLMDDEYPGSNKYFYTETQKTEKDYPVFTITPSELEDVVEDMRMEDEDFWD